MMNKSKVKLHIKIVAFMAFVALIACQLLTTAAFAVNGDGDGSQAKAEATGATPIDSSYPCDGEVLDDVNVRSGAGTNYDVVTELKQGAWVRVTGLVAGEDGHNWFSVTATVDGKEITGYSRANYIWLSKAEQPSTEPNDDEEGSEAPEVTDEAPSESEEPDDEILFAPAAASTYNFEAELAKFPESYKSAIRALRTKYPSWEFYADITNLSWDTLVSKESKKGTNLVPKSSNSAYIDQTDKNSNGTQKEYETGWVQASDAAIRYYLDPRNFLDETRVFMFENLTYNPAHKQSGVEAILTTSSFIYKKGYAPTIMKAAENSNVSAYHMAARLRQEQGNNGNALGTGTIYNGRTVYNLFNISATPKNGLTSIQNGALYASTSGSFSRPWTTAELSITGGAQFLSADYINNSKNQNTIYYQKFDIKAFNHQYMQNIMAPYSEASNTRTGYVNAGLLNTTIKFTIPVYTNMPANASPKPENANAPTPKISLSLTESGGYITKLGSITTADQLLGKISVTDGYARVCNTAGNQITGSAKIGTGHTLRVYQTNGVLYKTYYVVFKGDLNGDGAITAADLVFTRKHLLGSSKLTGAYLKAADLNGDGQVTMADHIVIRKHLLGMSSITQN